MGAVGEEDYADTVQLSCLYRTTRLVVAMWPSLHRNQLEFLLLLVAKVDWTTF